jgi:nitrogenase-associated protein
MSTVVFYEKPGCLTNAKQKAALRSLGHELQVRDLLAEPWTAQRLRGFFGDLPLVDWVNPTAPRLRAGEVDVARLDEEQLLAAMLDDPLLIRRPLIETDAGRQCGFDDGPLLRALGVLSDAEVDMQACSRGGPEPHCDSVGEVR